MCLMNTSTDQTYESSYMRVVPDRKDAKEWRKKAKQIINHPLLNVLERYTGIEQPWGFLPAFALQSFYTVKFGKKCHMSKRARN